MGILVLVLFLAFLLIGMPIAFGVGLSALVILLFKGISLTVVAQKMYSGLDSFTLLSIPFFILAGAIMDRGDLSKKIVAFINCFIGFVTGGLAQVTVGASMFFAGISGSALADISAVGSLMIPAMKKNGYDVRFAAALQSAAGTIGVIIPPSIPIILYSVISGASVKDLFLAGTIPGVLVGVSLMVYAYFISKKRNYAGVEVHFSFKKVFKLFFDALPAMLMPIIIVGAIITGVVTATESAVIAVVYSLIIAGVYYRTIKFKDLPSIFLDAIRTSSKVLIIITFASAFAYLLVIEQIPQMIASSLSSFSGSTITILLILNVLFLIVGTFLEMGPAILILVPVLMPILTQFNIDPVHFGIIMVVNLAIGMLTPPMGTGLIVSSGVAGIPIRSVIKEVLPMIAVMIAVLMIVTYIPQTVMFLPNLFK